MYQRWGLTSKALERNLRKENGIGKIILKKPLRQYGRLNIREES